MYEVAASCMKLYTHIQDISNIYFKEMYESYSKQRQGQTKTALHMFGTSLKYAEMCQTASSGIKVVPLEREKNLDNTKLTRTPLGTAKRSRKGYVARLGLSNIFRMVSV